MVHKKHLDLCNRGGKTYTASGVYVPNASSASISCDNGTGTITATNSYTATVTVTNITGNTVCDISY
ncbi:MAG: hypothetical protein IJZ46_02810 [Bacilli bacterium]|nr:hypothetical protein [Bacilli bacterium]